MSRNESCMNILTDSLDTHVVHPCAGVNGYRGSIEFFRVETFLFHPCNRGLQITHSEFELLNVETDLGGIDMCRVFHELITVYDILVIVNIFSSEYVLVSNFRGSSFPVFIFLLYRFIACRPFVTTFPTFLKMAGSFTAIPLKNGSHPLEDRYARTTMQIYFLISNNMQNKFPAIKGRILYIAEIKWFGKKNFCEKIGMSYGSFTGQAKNTPLNSNAIANILCIVPDVNLHWLLTGIGDAVIVEQELDSSSIRGENTAKDSMIAELMTIIRTQAETLLQQQNFINDHFMELHQKKIPPPALARNILIKSILKSSSVFDIL